MRSPQFGAFRHCVGEADRPEPQTGIGHPLLEFHQCGTHVQAGLRIA
jgi:hypothetical protein